MDDAKIKEIIKTSKEMLDAGKSRNEIEKRMALDGIKVIWGIPKDGQDKWLALDGLHQT